MNDPFSYTACLRLTGVVLLACLLTRASWPGHAQEVAKPSAEDLALYEKQVRPLLAENCYKCHSHAASKAAGGLVVDTPAGLLKGGDTGPAVVPGDPDKSLLLKAVRQTGDVKMPPGGKKLTDEQIALLERWVKSGAPTPAARAAHKP